MSGAGPGAISSRRGGTGSIRERSPGHYELRAYNPVTGKQVTRTFRAPRPEKGSGIRAAGAGLAKLVAEVAEGKHDRDGHRATVAEVLEDWLTQRASVGRSPTTLHDYAASARRIKVSAVGTKMMARLTTRDIDLAYSRWRAGDMTAATVLHHHRVLRAATALLGARRAGAEADAAAAGITLAQEGFVWSPVADGNAPRTPDSLTRAFARLCGLPEAEAKAPGRRERYQFRLHDLRPDYLSLKRPLVLPGRPISVCAPAFCSNTSAEFSRLARIPSCRCGSILPVTA